MDLFGDPYFAYLSVITRLGSVQLLSLVRLCMGPHGLQLARLPCPSPTPRACSNSCPYSWWCHPTISSSVIPFSSCLQSFPVSRSFLRSQFFTSGSQSIGVSASVLPMNIYDWFPLRFTGWISLQSKGLSRVFSNTTVQKHQLFGAQLSLWSNSHIHNKTTNWNHSIPWDLVRLSKNMILRHVNTLRYSLKSLCKFL